MSRRRSQIIALVMIYALFCTLPIILAGASLVVLALLPLLLLPALAGLSRGRGRAGEGSARRMAESVGWGLLACCPGAAGASWPSREALADAHCLAAPGQ